MKHDRVLHATQRVQGVRQLFIGWPAHKIVTLHRIAKRTGMFRDPRDMKTLRHLALRAQLSEANA